MQEPNPARPLHLQGTSAHHTTPADNEAIRYVRRSYQHTRLTWSTAVKAVIAFVLLFWIMIGFCLAAYAVYILR